MKVTEVDVGGERVAIEVDGNGLFHAEYDEVYVSGGTLAEVKSQLAKLNRKEQDKRAVEVTVVGLVPTDMTLEEHRWGKGDPFSPGIGVVNAKLIGKHQRTREWRLVADSTDPQERKKFTLSNYGSKTELLCRRLSIGEALEYIRLATALRDAQDRLDVWTKERRLNPATAWGEIE